MNDIVLTIWTIKKTAPHKERSWKAKKVVVYSSPAVGAYW